MIDVGARVPDLPLMYSRIVRGIGRSIFLIDPDGHVTHVWRKVRVPGHARAVFDALRASQGSDPSPSIHRQTR